MAYFREECSVKQASLCPRLAQVREDLITHSPQRPVTSSKISSSRIEGVYNVPEMLNHLLSPTAHTTLHTLSDDTEQIRYDDVDDTPGSP